MNAYIEYLSKRLAGNGIFINDKYQLLLIAPQKCGSTSILKALYDSLVEPSKKYEKTFSHEYIKELCIHKHLKSTQDSSTSNIKRVLADANYKKILVIRDPIDRLCSSICSKYLLEATSFYKLEIENRLTNKSPLLQSYKNTDDFLNNFNKIANILLTKGAIFEDEQSSHASPISEIIPKELLPFFDKINITNKEGWSILKKSINQHLSKHQDNIKIEEFPHVNENPLSKSRRFLSRENISTAYGRYIDDYTNLRIEHPNPDEHKQTPPTIQELKSLNTFISLANRSVDLFNIGIKEHKSKLEVYKSRLKAKAEVYKSRLKANAKDNAKKLSKLTIQNKQLIVLEELSKRTAEELLAESHALKVLNRNLKEEIKKISETVAAERTSTLDLITLTRRAEKRVRNKNFKAAQELLNQAYAMDQNNRSIMLRLWAVSNRNPIIRSLMLMITPSAKSSKTSINEV